jgi:hypothetical protein
VDEIYQQVIAVGDEYLVPIRTPAEVAHIPTPEGGFDQQDPALRRIIGDIVAYRVEAISSEITKRTIVLDFVNIDLAQTRDLAGMLGLKYLPSALYRMRTLTFSSDAQLAGAIPARIDRGPQRSPAP